MGRRTVARVALAAAWLGALAACVVNLSFDMDQPGIPLQTTGAGPVSQNVAIDLTSYGDVRDHQNDIRSLDLDSVDVTITSVNPGNLAQTVSATLTLRKNLADPSTEVKIGDVSGLQVLRNSRQQIRGNPALDAFLLERLHDGGKFYLLLSGTSDAKIDAVVDVLLHASMGYETGLF